MEDRYCHAFCNVVQDLVKEGRSVMFYQVPGDSRHCACVTWQRNNRILSAPTFEELINELAEWAIEEGLFPPKSSSLVERGGDGYIGPEVVRSP